jgi:integrase
MNWTITEDSARKFKFGPKEWKADKIKFDEKFPGFGLRIRTDENTGRELRTYIFQYKLGHKHRRMNCGRVGKVTASQARKAAEGHAASLVHHKDPANERAAIRKEASRTIGATIAKYLEAKRPKMRPRSHYGTAHHLETNWKPLHGLSINNVSRANVAAEIGAIARRSGPVAANRSRASLSAFFRWAIGEGLCDHNPVAGTNQQQENGPRERILTDAEAAAIFLACPEGAYGRIVQLLMLTGCRRDEIGGLRWSEIDFDAKTITLPGARTKNKSEHVVPLSDRVLAILEAIPRREGNVHVFGIVEGGYKGFSVSKAKLDKKVNLKDPWTIHDIRRTVRTGLGMLGVAPHIAEAVLNHLPAKLIRTYDRNTYEPEKRAALELWANHLAVAVAKLSGANVTTLRKA